MERLGVLDGESGSRGNKMTGLECKRRKLEERLEQYAKEDTVLAFSGGVDSSLLLYILCEKARRYGTKVYAVTFHTTMHPMYELDLTKNMAHHAGAVYSVIHVDELEEAGISENPIDRCYRCKRYLYQNLLTYAKEVHVTRVIEGTNEDDMHQYRPGIRAVKELGILSPLAEIHMTKAEVRQLAEEYQIMVANRPSTPCLATRFPYGTMLTKDKMRQVELAEDYVRKLGFYNVRVRVHGDIARLEIDAEEMEKLLEYRDRIVSFLKQTGYRYVTLDLEGFRSGSMDAGAENDRSSHVSEDVSK